MCSSKSIFTLDATSSSCFATGLLVRSLFIPTHISHQASHFACTSDFVMILAHFSAMPATYRTRTAVAPKPSAIHLNRTPICMQRLALDASNSATMIAVCLLPRLGSARAGDIATPSGTGEDIWLPLSTNTARHSSPRNSTT